jgi:DHA1 family bicyclomycin/chloramphenicol resistance-like MFS transporter
MTGFGVLSAPRAFFRLKESRSEETSAHAATETPFQAYVALLRQPRLDRLCLAGALNGATLVHLDLRLGRPADGTYGLAPSLYASCSAPGPWA